MLDKKLNPATLKPHLKNDKSIRVYIGLLGSHGLEVIIVVYIRL